VKFEIKKYETMGGPPKPVEPPINPLRDPKKKLGKVFSFNIYFKIKKQN